MAEIRQFVEVIVRVSGLTGLDACNGRASTLAEVVVTRCAPGTLVVQDPPDEERALALAEDVADLMGEDSADLYDAIKERIVNGK